MSGGKVSTLLCTVCAALVMVGGTVMWSDTCWGIAPDALPSVEELIAQGGFPRKDTSLGAGAKQIPLPQRGRKVSVFEAGILSQSDTEYVLDRDVVADGTAFVIKASHITLNLNGHTVTYLNKPAVEESYGVYIPGHQRKDICIANGRILQGAGATATKVSCPVIRNYDASGFEVGGLEIAYQTPDTSGILLNWVSDVRVHENTIVDEGNIVTNRHQGVAVIEANRGGKAARHTITGNVIRGARHNAIRAGAESTVTGNDIQIESAVTNSTGISSSGVITGNRIIGEGVHPIGIWPGSNVIVSGNYVEVHNTRTGTEYGDTGAACLRMTWGNDNVEVMNNTFILRAGENKETGVKSWGRALWVGLPKPEQKVVFHDNLIAATNDDGKTKAAAIAVVCLNESPNLVFRHNTVVSNWSTVLLADTYGHAGGYARFVDNRFVGSGGGQGFRTIRSQYSPNASTGVFIANTFENGASPNDLDLDFDGKGLKEVAFGWHLTVTVINGSVPCSGAEVIIRDIEGDSVFQGKTVEDGTVTADIVASVISNRASSPSVKRTPLSGGAKAFTVRKTPHTIIVKYEDTSVEKQVTMDTSKTITINLKE